MASLFYAEQVTSIKRRAGLLRELNARAKRYGLGEIVQRIAVLLCLWLVVGVGVLQHTSTELVPHAEVIEQKTVRSAKDKRPTLSRGNTGG